MRMRSTSATGFRGKSYALRARSMIPWRISSSLAPWRTGVVLGEPADLPRLDSPRRYLVDRQRAELGQQVALQDGAAVDERRALPAALVLAPAQPLDRGLLERHARARELDRPAA